MSTTLTSSDAPVQEIKKSGPDSVAVSSKSTVQSTGKDTIKETIEKTATAPANPKETKSSPSKVSQEKKSPVKTPNKPTDPKKASNGAPAVSVTTGKPDSTTIPVKAPSTPPKPQRTPSNLSMGNSVGSETEEGKQRIQRTPSNLSMGKAVGSETEEGKQPSAPNASTQQKAAASPPKATTGAKASASPPKAVATGSSTPPNSPKPNPEQKAPSPSTKSSPPKAAVEQKPAPASPPKATEKKVVTVVPPASAIESKVSVVTPDSKSNIEKSDLNAGATAQPEKKETEVTGVKPLTKDSAEVKEKGNSEGNMDSAKEKKETGAKVDSDKSKNKKSSESGTSPEMSHSTSIGSEDTTTKQKYRLDVWNKLKLLGQLERNLSCYYRIPHFKGENDALEKLKNLEIFKKSKVVKVNLDKAHEGLRRLCIQEKKELIVGFPGLREAVFLHMSPPLQESEHAHRMAATPAGISRLGTALDFGSTIKADLIIVTTVAVDKHGRRIGKGEGFSDLEYALLKKVDCIAENAPVVTLVHDLQVYDNLPEDLFKPHDVSADVIVTPTQTIEVNPRRKQPELMWNLLSQRRVNCIPFIKNLLDVEKNSDSGSDIQLKDTDTDVEEMEPIKLRKKYFARRRRFHSVSSAISANGNQDSGRGRSQRMMNPNPRRSFNYQRSKSVPPQGRGFSQMPRRRRWITFSRSQNKRMPPLQPMQRSPIQSQGMRRKSSLKMQPQRWPRIWKKMPAKIEFSIKVEGLTKTLRVRNLKAALYQRGVRPRDITWMPNKGCAFLHFAKGKAQPQETTFLPPFSADGILASLKDFAVANDSGNLSSLTCCCALPVKRVGDSAPIESQPQPTAV